MGIRVLPRAECNHSLSVTCPVCTFNILAAGWPSFDADDIEECGLPLLMTIWDRVVGTSNAEEFDVQLIPDDEGDRS